VADPVVLEGAHVRLAPLRPDHVADLVRAAGAERDLYRYAIVPDGPAAMAAYVAEALDEQAAGRQLPFVTIRREDGRVVGTTRFFETEPWRWPDGHPAQRVGRPDVVEIGGTWLAAGARRTAVNTEAKLLMLTHAFEEWQVYRVALRTDVRNSVSRRAIERLGARFEGVRRADRPGADGTVRDSAFYSIVAEEWPSARTALRSLLSRPTG
jgi:N-acetyltransferase